MKEYVELNKNYLDTVSDREAIYVEFINTDVYINNFCFKKHKIIYDKYHKSFVNDDTLIKGKDFCTLDGLMDDLENEYAKIYKYE